EAELLLRKFLRLDRTSFYLRLPEQFPAHRWNEWEEWLKRRKAQQPIQYILREQEFYGRIFEVDPSVLIPRPETELLIEHVLAYLDKNQSTPSPSVVDLGTGSGVIAVTLAKERANLNVTAIDCSEDALRIAARNAKRHGVEDRVSFLRGDFLAPLKDRHRIIDVVVSNPPYIPTDQIQQLESQVRDFEPHLALDGGSDGLQAYRTILSQLTSWDLCATRCMIAFEIGWNQKREIIQLFSTFFPHARIEVFQDLAGLDRIVLAELV